VRVALLGHYDAGALRSKMINAMGRSAVRLGRVWDQIEQHGSQLMRKSWIQTARRLGLAILVASAIAGCSSSQNPAASGSAGISPADPVISDAQINAIVMKSCFGCHSNGDRTPWYVTVAPSYWWNRSGAREAVNFSDWQTYDPQRRAAAIQAIAASVGSGRMPPSDYTLFDSSARLSDAQAQAVVEWAAEQLARPAH